MSNLAKRRPNKERQKIYKMLRKRKFSRVQAERMRDWTKKHIDRHIEMNKQKPIKMKFSPIYRKNIQEDFRQDMHTCERTTCQKVMSTKKYVDSTCPYCSKKQTTIQNLESKNGNS